MRVLHILPELNREGGGPVRSCQGLVAALRNAGVDVWLMSLARGEEPWFKGVDQFVNGEPFEVVFQRLKPDLVHLHGLWRPELHRCALICRRWKVPYLIAPRGMLEPWSLQQKYWKKRLARFLYQDGDLKHAAALHATAQSEAEQFRKLGFNNTCIVSPNGVNLPEREVWNRKVKIGNVGVKRALFVSRMHAKKGVMELVESWTRVKPSGWVCELVYTLNDENEKMYEAQVKAKVKELGQEEHFIFTGALDDEKKWAAYARANLFILPTYSENFGIVVAEALWAGVPVITTKGTPWQDLLDYKCGWWIDLPPKESLDRALTEVCCARGVPSLPEMGANGHRLVEEKYTWTAVIKPLIRGYEQLLNR